jgi:microcystin degradation protein MlrC
MTKRVLIAGFKHETNTFSKLPTTLDSYRARGLHHGAAIRDAFTGTNTEIAAFLDGATRHGWEAVLAVAADATPSGRLTEVTYEAIAGEILSVAEASGPLDAVLLNLHGAMVAEHTDDGEGTLLRRLRAALGRTVLIGATLDLHANVTTLMARDADMLISYRTYPHIDMYDTGMRLVALAARALQGEIHPKTFLAHSPKNMLIGVDQGRTTAPGPMTEMLDKGDAMLRADPGMLSFSVNAGFAWSDIPEVGPTAIIVGNGEYPRFQAAADAMMATVWSDRNRKTVETVSLASAMAVARSKGVPGKPVVIADYADNPGGGGYGDTTGLLRAMIAAKLDNAALATIYDPATATACHAAGVGATIALHLGGKVDPAFGAPIAADATVMHLSDGRFKIEGPMLKGFAINLGPTATVRIGGIDVVVSSQRFQNYDRMFFRVGGIDPEAKSVLAVKSSQHFRAAYAPIASDIVVVDEGGGVMSTDFKRLPYTRVPRPIFPIDLD